MKAKRGAHDEGAGGLQQRRHTHFLRVGIRMKTVRYRHHYVDNVNVICQGTIGGVDATWTETATYANITPKPCQVLMWPDTEGDNGSRAHYDKHVAMTDPTSAFCFYGRRV